MKISLFTTSYNETNPKRRCEYVSCLARNRQNPFIGSIYILDEASVGIIPDTEKIITRAVATRPTYQQFFAWANEVQGNDDITIVANGDIYFDSQIRILPRVIRRRQCFALSRWDITATGPRLFDRGDSQDTWIFKGKIKCDDGGYAVGVPGGDNRIIGDLLIAGYDVLNPSFSVKSYHLHKDGRTEYGWQKNSVPGPYHYIYPHNLYGPLRTRLFNLFISGRSAARSDKGLLFRY